MNKRELIEAVCSELETTKSAAEETVNIVLQAIKDGVASDDQVSIAGFGTWSKRSRAARTGRNPQTGETMQIKASKSVGFKPAKAWKDSVNGK
ncbi:MAG: HU family DNA-binding protein [Planctomycetes bacterium]|nr:HU family DNA-binding protein [Planctomycetota bacterium]